MFASAAVWRRRSRAWLLIAGGDQLVHDQKSVALCILVDFTRRRRQRETLLDVELVAGRLAAVEPTGDDDDETGSGDDPDEGSGDDDPLALAKKANAAAPKAPAGTDAPSTVIADDIGSW